MLERSAGYHNSYGYYLAGENGEPTTGGIWADVKDSVGQTFNLEGVESKVGFFLIPNGDNVNKVCPTGKKSLLSRSKGNWSPVVDGQTLRGRAVLPCTVILN